MGRKLISTTTKRRILRSFLKMSEFTWLCFGSHGMIVELSRRDMRPGLVSRTFFRDASTYGSSPMDLREASDLYGDLDAYWLVVSPYTVNTFVVELDEIDHEEVFEHMNTARRIAGYCEFNTMRWLTLPCWGNARRIKKYHVYSVPDREGAL